MPLEISDEDVDRMADTMLHMLGGMFAQFTDDMLSSVLAMVEGEKHTRQSLLEKLDE